MATYPISDLKSVLRTCANSTDPVQTPKNAASDQDLHCLLTGISMQNTIQMNTSPRTPKIKNVLIKMVRIVSERNRLQRPTNNKVIRGWDRGLG